MSKQRHFSLMRFIAKARFLSERRRMELFPPFWLMRIRVLELSEDWRTVRIRLPLTMLARNGGGGMFGGFQASLADPIPALACLRVFPGHSVWTRRLALDFRREGRTDLELRFKFHPELESTIRRDLAETGRSTPEFEFGYYLADGRVCTVVHNTVAIRPRGYRKE
jgi:acyl-coenzyme A thioesterase PaaI-like protein